MELTESILKRFKEANPRLVALKPKIEVWELWDNSAQPTDEIKIFVKRPFLFDARLVPKEFENMQVQDIITTKFPKEFPSTKASLPWFEIFSPDYYINFVEGNPNLIRQKLNAPNLSKEEMLDALTGNFEAYKASCEKAKKDMLEAHADNIPFFKKLLADTDEEFRKSKILKDFGMDNQWYYSILETSIFKGSPMVVGFNWGAGKDGTYTPQTEYPLRRFESNYNELGSLKRTIPYFYKHYPEALSGMQSNFCFYRSQTESQVTQEDLKTSSKLFFKLLEFSEPSSLVVFSSQLRDHLLTQKLLVVQDQHAVQYKGKRHIAIKGISNFGIKKEIPIYCLPHPMAQIGGDERNELWEFCFGHKD